MPTALALVVCLFAAAAGGQFVPGRAVVRLARPASACRPALAALNSRWHVTDYSPLCPRPDARAREVGLDRLYLVSFDADADPTEFCTDFCANPLVEYACPDALLPLDSMPNDSLYPLEWHLEHIGAPKAWQQAHGDSTVLLACIADGVHWTHPDLEPNLWVNTAEDANHNGRFDPQPAPAGDIDSVDNDGNGYVDDVIGWDFLDRDCNPVAAGATAAGTHGAGVQNAATDNGIGVSAPPWNVRSVAVRAGDQGSISLSAAIQAIVYLVANHAWAFAMPFGSTSQYQPLADACLYAWNSGVVPCAGAGGSGGETPSYPAACAGVIAVAAHGPDNRKSAFSNYGTWIDVTAPGEDIISTQGASGYESWDGTGPACNVVVGVLGWVKSAYPDISNDSAFQVLRNMCDTMPDPLYWQGKLGAGRVRMSIAATDLVEQGSAPAPTLGPATVVRSVLHLPWDMTELPGDSDRVPRPTLLDATGRKMLYLQAGPNDVSALPPGVYFIRPRDASATRKVVVSR